MSKPRSSRRTSARIAAFHVDDEIEVSSSLLQSDSLGDGVSGAGPPALSLQRDADLAEAPGSIAHKESTEPSFDARRFDFAIIDDRAIASSDKWAKRLVGKQLKHKQEELEDDVDFKDKRPTNVFIAHSIATRSAEKTQLLSASIRRARRSLRFACCSVDALNDDELTPVASLHPTLQERSRLYQTVAGRL